MDAAFGVETTIDIDKHETCDVCDGQGVEPGTQVETCPHCRGVQARSAAARVFLPFAPPALSAGAPVNSSRIPVKSAVATARRKIL